MFLALFSTFLVGFSFLTVLIWVLLADTLLSLYFGAALSLVLFLAWWLVSPMIIESCVDVSWIDRESDPLLWNMVEEEAESAGAKVRRVGIADFEAPNAFTYGYTGGLSKMVFTRGLVIALNAPEMRTVITHELGHIKHGDMTIITPLVALLAVYYKIAQSYIRSRLNNERSPIHQLVLAAFAYIFFRLTYPQTGLLSRIREDYADDFSIRQTKDPSHLVNSLVKISRGCALKPMDKLRVEGSPLRSLMFLDPTAAINEMGDLEEFLSSKWDIDLGRLTAFLGLQPVKGSEEIGFHTFEGFKSHPALRGRLERIVEVGKEFQTPMIIGLTR
ncbi:MAG: M48 family metalloprotease, partial [Candidatus Bathyarchaeia archaeon]